MPEEDLEAMAAWTVQREFVIREELSDALCVHMDVAVLLRKQSSSSGLKLSVRLIPISISSIDLYL